MRALHPLLTKFLNFELGIKGSLISMAVTAVGGGLFLYSLGVPPLVPSEFPISQTGRPAEDIADSTMVVPEAAQAPAPAPAPAPSPAPKPAPAAAPAPKPACTNPIFTTSDTNGGWSTNGYYVHNNMWNTGEAGPETLFACSYKNWYVISRQQDLASNPGSVKTYPNVHKDYNNDPLITSFPRITSSFAAATPHLGIYNVAYDIWINGIADNNSTEVMIWTENYKQVPSGNIVDTVAFKGVTYKVWKTNSSKYIAFVPANVMTSGTLDIKAMLTYIQGKGWLASNATLGQICYGVEIVSTNNTDQSFTFTDFSIQDT